jgi:hypothetical protein
LPRIGEILGIRSVPIEFKARRNVE